MVTVFREKLNLQLPIIFYSSVRFVFETSFISEQIEENRIGALLEISDKFITKFTVFSYLILQFRLKTVWKISKPYCMTLKTVARQFCLKGHSLYHKVRDELLEVGKDLKIKHSLSSPPANYGGTFFIKKLCIGEQTFLGKLFGECFAWGLMINHARGDVNGKEVSKVESSQFFLSLTLTWVIDILFEKLTLQIGD